MKEIPPLAGWPTQTKVVHNPEPEESLAPKKRHSHKRKHPKRKYR